MFFFLLFLQPGGEATYEAMYEAMSQGTTSGDVIYDQAGNPILPKATATMGVVRAFYLPAPF